MFKQWVIYLVVCVCGSLMAWLLCVCFSSWEKRIYFFPFWKSAFLFLATATSSMCLCAILLLWLVLKPGFLFPLWPGEWDSFYQQPRSTEQASWHHVEAPGIRSSSTWLNGMHDCGLLSYDPLPFFFFSFMNFCLGALRNSPLFCFFFKFCFFMTQD